MNSLAVAFLVTVLSAPISDIAFFNPVVKQKRFVLQHEFVVHDYVYTVLLDTKNNTQHVFQCDPRGVLKEVE